LQCLSGARRAMAAYESQQQQSPHGTSGQFAWTSFYKSNTLQSPDRCLDVWYYLPNIEVARADRQHFNVLVTRAFPVHKKLNK